MMIYQYLALCAPFLLLLGRLQSASDGDAYKKYLEQLAVFQKQMIKLAEVDEQPLPQILLPAYQYYGKFYRPYGSKHLGILGLLHHPCEEAIPVLLDNLEFRASSSTAFTSAGHFLQNSDKPVASALLKLGKPAMDALVIRLGKKEFDLCYHGSGVAILIDYFGKELAVARLELEVKRSPAYTDNLTRCIEMMKK